MAPALMERGRSAPMLMSLRLVGAAAKVPASAASYGVVDNDRQILQH
jgi:hypothetical protein